MADVSVKDETGNYTVATSFGKRRRIRKDVEISRPATIVETIFQIEICYAENHWDASEQMTNHRLLGLGEKTLMDLTGDELEIVRADMERRRMILYED